MKKIFLVFSLMFVLSACSSTQPASTNSTATDSSNNSVVDSGQLSKSDSSKTNTQDNSINNQKTMDNKTEKPSDDLTGKYAGVVMKTNMGDITLKLYGEASPVTVNNFLNLAKSDYYDGIKFHRVIRDFMIQGGDPLTKDDKLMNRWGTGGPGYSIDDEYIDGLSNVRGTISMANAGPNTGGSQFFINLVNNTNLDWDKQPTTSKHPVFGEVVKGLDVVDAIAVLETDGRDRPVDAVIIEDIELLEEVE